VRQPLFDLTHLTDHSTPATDCFGVYLPKSLNSGNRLFWGLFTQITQLRQPIFFGFLYPNHSTPATDCFGVYLPKSLNSGNRLFWGTLKFSWYFSATAELLPSVVKQSSSFPKSSRRKLSENKCCL